MPQRYGRSLTAFTTRRCFSSPDSALFPEVAGCLGMPDARGNSNRSPRLSMPCTDRVAYVYARPKPQPMSAFDARRYGRSIWTCNASYQVLPSFDEYMKLLKPWGPVSNVMQHEPLALSAMLAQFIVNW